MVALQTDFSSNFKFFFSMRLKSYSGSKKGIRENMP